MGFDNIKQYHIQEFCQIHISGRLGHNEKDNPNVIDNTATEV